MAVAAVVVVVVVVVVAGAFLNSRLAWKMTRTAIASNADTVDGVHDGEPPMR